MSVESIGARVAEIDARIVALTRGPQAPAATDFAQALASAQSTSVPAAAQMGAGGPVPYGAEIDAAAARHGVDPALLKGLVRQESGFDPAARSSAGALGLTQLMPGTAAGLGVDASDPLQALEGGARYLRQQLDRFGGDPAMALAAYNAGPGAVAKFGGIPPYAETQGYVQKVLGFAEQYRGAAATTPAPIPPIPTPPVPAGGSLPYSTT
jgi:soluble lytic murein transglycosylase-like protein